MEVFLETDYDLLLTMEFGYEAPEGKARNQWSKKEQADHVANKKAEFHLLSVLPTQEVNRVGTYNSAKELWEKFLELHEGTSEAKLARRDLLRNQLTNLRFEEGETIAHLHSRIQELITRLTNLGEEVSNRDSLRYALNSFPRNSKWASLVDAFYISKDLEKISLDEFFSTFEVHESRCAGPKEPKNNVALKASRDEPESESSLDDEEMVMMVRRFKNICKSRKSNHPQGRKKRTIRCYHCDEEGHVKDNCPKLKNNGKDKGKKPIQNRKALKATWDDTSSESEVKEFSGLALMASHQDDDCESSSSEMSIESIDEGGATSEESSSSGGETDNEIDKVSEVRSLPPNKMFKFIKILTKDCCKLENENKDLKAILATSCPLEMLDKSNLENEKLKLEIQNLIVQVENLKNSACSSKTNFRRFNNLNWYYRYHQGQIKNISRKYVPKNFLVNPVGWNLYWVPKSCLN